MSGNFKKKDLRIIKTNKAIINAMSKLLENQNFNQMTINDLCEEAQLSRTTFYLHFIDKYDLLRYWLSILKSEIITKTDTYEDLEKNLNYFVNKNTKIIKNLIENSNSETFEILSDFILSLFDIYIEKTDNKQMNTKDIVFSKFLSGGILNYLLWQIKNKFPEDLKTINIYFYDILKNLLKCYKEE